jgi:hypothetical protein
MKKEVWKDVVGYKGYYKVSNLGRIKGIARLIKTGKNRKTHLPEKIKVKGLNTWGYEMLGLSKKDIKKMYSVHRLVALAFIPNPENKREVNHKNGIKTDNRVENLEWLTPKENTRHAFDVLHVKGSMLGKKGKDCHNSKPVNQYDMNYKFIKSFESLTHASEELGINKTCICLCCKHKIKSSAHFKWEYA